MSALNAAAALVVAGRAVTPAQSVQQATAALEDGRARATLEHLIRVSNEA